MSNYFNILGLCLDVFGVLLFLLARDNAVITEIKKIRLRDGRSAEQTSSKDISQEYIRWRRIKPLAVGCIILGFLAQITANIINIRNH